MIEDPRPRFGPNNQDTGRFALAAASGRKITATLIHVFDRDDCEGDTPAPTFHNLAAAVFNQLPQASRVALFNTERGTLLFLIEAAHRWFDVAANSVNVSRNP